VNAGLLFAACVLIWGTTWLGIKFQLDALAPEPGVALRFLCAAVFLAGFCRWRGIAMRFPVRIHALFATQGLAGFCVSYVLIYHAERYIVSGLVAVGYAASPLANLVLARVLFGTPMSPRVAMGGALGLAGIVLIFLHEFARLSIDETLLAGAVLTMTAVFLSSVAGMAATRYHQLGVHGWAPLTWAMLYGGGATALFALVSGRSFSIVWSTPFVASFIYLVVGGSILAFGAFYALVHRLGVARAGYVGVMTPIVALIVSSLFEGFDWSAPTLFGVALAVAGNLIALATSAPRQVHEEFRCQPRVRALSRRDRGPQE
jgi:drug/metabolite transporter (DMT)-like permease